MLKTNYKKLASDRLSRSKFQNPYMSKIFEFPDIVVTSEALKKTIIDKNKKFSKFHIDFGCGNGELLESLASKNKDILFLGVELQYKELYRAAKRAHVAGLDNVLFVRERAEFIPDILNTINFNSVSVYFPDPWPKFKHRENRLLNKKFFKSIAQRMSIDALFYIKTDSDQYFKEIVKNAYSIDKLEIKTLSTDALNPKYKSRYKLNVPPSAFERIFIRQGQMINYLVLQKKYSDE